AGPNGTIMPSGALTVNQGDNIAFTIMPNSGYQVQSVLVDGVNKGAITSYTFVSVYADHSISASFALIEADTTPPTGTIAINGGAAYTTSRSVTLTLSCDANDCTQIQLSNDTVTWTTASYAPSQNWRLAAGNGLRSVYVRYSDAAGNWSEVYSGVIIYDDTAPTNGTLSATAIPGTIALTWTGFSDAVSGLSSYTLVYSTKSTPSSCSTGLVLYSGPGTSYTHTGVAPGTTYNYRLCATDSAGNVSKGITTKVKAP
ncbi:MAG TPA: fibronectin type III domain-containing protein, partial [Nitrospirota bacterium]|nr:fibronectin type III domain-containing protein [Nitrospirota bacterium]